MIRDTNAPGTLEEVRVKLIPMAQKLSRGSPRVFATAKLPRWTPQRPQDRTSRGGVLNHNTYAGLRQIGVDKLIVICIYCAE